MRQVLLIEPNYKNKYPPIGLMKLSTYHKMLGDKVTFFKGTFKDFIIDEIYGELYEKLVANNKMIDWGEYRELITNYISKGYEKDFKAISKIDNDPLVLENLIYYRNYYIHKEYIKNPRWDRICISTLFTFYWKETIETINFFKCMCKSENEVWVGGVAASVVPKDLLRDTGIRATQGLLDKPRIMDDNDIIIDTLPLDYSILYETDYKYPESNGYYGYMTRGCVNRCRFCAVPTIEPIFNPYISIKEQIEYVENKFGAKQNLLLLDNNVLASDRFFDIVDEIKECGFAKDNKFIAPNEYEIAIKGLCSGYNDKGYIRHIISLYKQLHKKLKPDKQNEFYSILKQLGLTNIYTAKKNTIIQLDKKIAPLFREQRKPKPRVRSVDFNQGVDARFLTPEKVKKLAEIPIRPLRIAFDSWKYKDVYEQAVRLAAKEGINNMSNYLLYNYEDEPIELYLRLKKNIDLCEELGVSIYSFPMKYHPINDPLYFKNRTYLGKHWNRKFIRSIQAILNSTKGKIGRGKSFFEEAFGSNEQEFEKLLYMPEALIIYRFHYKYNVTEDWWNDFISLDKEKLDILKQIVQQNDFNDISLLSDDKDILKVLKYYTIRRDDAELEMKINDFNETVL